MAAHTDGSVAWTAADCRKLTDQEIMTRLATAAEQNKISQRTLLTYRAALARTKDALDRPFCQLLMLPATTFKALKSKIGNEKTLEVTVASLLGVMKHVGLRDGVTEFNLWRGIQRPLQARTAWHAQNGVPTPRQVAGLLDWSDVVKKNDELKATEYGSAEQLLSSMYVDLPPRRQSDYYRTYLVRRKQDLAAGRSEPAYIDLTKSPAVLHVQEYKTAKAHGEWKTVLPNTLDVALRTSLVQRPRTHLFMGSNNKPYETADTFTKFHNKALKTWFGAGVTNNSLRHAMATRAENTHMTLKQREVLAKAMAHTLATHRSYARNEPMRADGTFVMWRDVNGTTAPFVCSKEVSRKPTGALN
jgi:integrase